MPEHPNAASTERPLVHDDIAVLAAFAAQRSGGAGRMEPPPSLGGDRSRFAGACLRLVAAFALVPRPHSPGGHEASLIGLARLNRFLMAPIRLGPDRCLTDEIRLRRIVLDALDISDRPAALARITGELIELRTMVFRCAHADLCAGRGCPFEAAMTIEEIDAALVELSAGEP